MEILHYGLRYQSAQYLLEQALLGILFPNLGLTGRMNLSFQVRRGGKRIYIFVDAKLKFSTSTVGYSKKPNGKLGRPLHLAFLIVKKIKYLTTLTYYPTSYNLSVMEWLFIFISKHRMFMCKRKCYILLYCQERYGVT